MGWDGYGHMNGWGWAAMTFGWLLLLALLVLVGVLVARLGRRSPGDGQPPGRPSAEQILAERYARGEIDDEEYRRRLTTLR